MILIDGKPMDIVAQELKEKYERSGDKEAVAILCLVEFWEKNHVQKTPQEKAIDFLSQKFGMVPEGSNLIELKNAITWAGIDNFSFDPDGFFRSASVYINRKNRIK